MDLCYTLDGLNSNVIVVSQYEYNPMSGDWSREMRGIPIISSPPLNDWILLYTRRNSNEAQSLLQTLGKVSGPLGLRLQRAVM